MRSQALESWNMTQHQVNVSGGEASWLTAEYVAEEQGTENLTLLFADVFMESPDTYRFLIESSAHVFNINRPRKIQQLCRKALALPPLKQMMWRKWALRELARETMRVIPGLIWIAEGRTPWEVFRDERFIGNTRVDLCSRILKREFLDAYMEANFNTSRTVRYFGLDANEEHRLIALRAHIGDLAIRQRRPFWHVRAPLIERGVFKEFIRGEAEKRGIKRSSSYDLNVGHDNCSNACVKAGQGSWRITLIQRPEVFAYAESEEQKCFDHIGRSDIGVLRDRTGGETRRISLAVFRGRVEQGMAVDRFDLGGCGCAV